MCPTCVSVNGADAIMNNTMDSLFKNKAPPDRRPICPAGQFSSQAHRKSPGAPDELSAPGHNT